MKVGKKSWATVLVFSEILRVSIALAAPVNERARLGMARLGETENPLHEKAFEIVETRVRRWLENLKEIRPDVKKLGASVKSEEWATAVSGTRLKTLSEKLLDLSLRGTPGEETLIAEGRQLRNRLSSRLELGPILQQSLFAEAMALWRLGEKKAASPLIRQSALLHPDGAIETMDKLSDREAATDPALSLFEANAVGATSNMNRQCSIEVRGLVKEQSLVVNGFEFGPRRNFQLPVGSSYLFQIGSTGESNRKGKVTCDRPGRRRLTFPTNLDDEAKIRFAAVADVRSIWLIETQGDRFHFYLFTPGMGLDEIPVQRPVLVADVLGDAGREALPISTDAVRMLFEKHQVAVAGFNPAALQMETDGREWYNKWEFWAIAGGVLAGGLVTYFATRDSGVKSQTSGLTIHWE